MTRKPFERAGYLFLFVDESGDMGFSLGQSKAASEFIVFAGVVCTDIDAGKVVRRARKRFPFRQKDIELKFSKLSPRFLRIAFAELNKIDYSWFACFADKRVLSPAFNHLSDSTRRGRLLDVLIYNVYYIAKLKGINGRFIAKD